MSKLIRKSFSQFRNSIKEASNCGTKHQHQTGRIRRTNGEGYPPKGGQQTQRKQAKSILRDIAMLLPIKSKERMETLTYAEKT